MTTRRPGRPADEPRPLRDSLAEVSADLGLPEPDALAFLIREWERLVGPDVAPHCRLTSLRDGVLPPTANVADEAAERELVERAAALVGADVVRELRVRVGSPSARRGR